MNKCLPVFLVTLSFLFSSCAHDKEVPQKKISLSIITEIGIEEAKTKEEEPYQFSFIWSVDCDEDGNIYVLDPKDVCIKVFDSNGIFLRKISSKGEGPHELMNPRRIKINDFRNSLFVLHYHGFQLKEFDVFGNYIKSYRLPEQMTHYYEFLSTHTLIYISSGKYGEDEYNSIKLINLDTLDIIQEFAPTKRYGNVNGTQRFVIQDTNLWTCPGDFMEFVGFDLSSGEIRRRIPINVPYNPFRIIRNEIGPGAAWEIIQKYNFAQPFNFSNTISVFLTQHEFPEHTSLNRRLPPDNQTIKMFRFENSELIDCGSFQEMEDFINIETTWKNRIVATCPYALFPKILILELN